MGYAIPNPTTNYKFIGLDSTKRSVFDGWTPIGMQKPNGDVVYIDEFRLREWVKGCTNDSPDLVEFTKAYEVYAKAAGGYYDKSIRINKTGIASHA